MGSIFKKIKSLAKHGIEPLEVGMMNYKREDIDIDLKAIERSKECVMCVNYVDEPIDFLSIEDKRIESLSKKMCDDCGCALPYLLRQDIKICKLWNE